MDECGIPRIIPGNGWVSRMEIPPEIALARLAPPPIRVRVGDRGTGEPALATDEILWALSRVRDPLAATLLRVKWVGEDLWRGDLEELAAERAVELFLARGWRVQYSRAMEKLVAVVIAQALRPDQCPRCRGREGPDGRTVTPNRDGVLETCPRCEGANLPPRISGRAVLRAMGIHRPGAWKEVWEERYEVLRSHFREQEAFALMAVSEALKMLATEQKRW